MLTKCPECGGAVSRARTVFEAHVGRRTVFVPGDYDRCGICGELVFGPGEMDAVMQRASELARTDEGLLTPAEIKAFRKSMGLTQPQLEQLLGAGPKTVGRWEKGTVIQNGATDTLLRVLRDVPEALEYLLAERGSSRRSAALVPTPNRVPPHRSSMTVRRVRLQSAEASDARLGRNVAERLEMVHTLSLEGWASTGRPFPSYSRSEIPFRRAMLVDPEDGAHS